MPVSANNGDASANSKLISFPSTMNTSRTASPRPSSPNSLIFRSTAQYGHTTGSNGGLQRTSDALTSVGDRARTLSSPSSLRRSSISGGKPSLDSGESNLWSNDADPFASNFAGGSTFATYATPPASTTTLPASNGAAKASSKHQRGSILLAASDALHFGRGLGAALAWRRNKPPTTSFEQNHSPLLHTSLWNGKGKSKGKGKWALQPPASPASTTFYPDVIEISAASNEKTNSSLLTFGASTHSTVPDEEELERVRLREAAAQSIGIVPLVREEEEPTSGSLDPNGIPLTVEPSGNAQQIRSDEEGEGDFAQNQSTVTGVSVIDLSKSSDAQSNGGPDNLLHVRPSNAAHSRRNPSVSSKVSPLIRSHQIAGEYGGPDSTVTNSSPTTPTDKMPPTTIDIPAFPCTRAALGFAEQMSATISKHYLSSSFLTFGIGRQWRSRLIVLTSPNSNSPKLASSLSSSARLSRGHRAFHLHLFKTAAAEERELERLEINENSIVFVADADVAGRRSVVKVGGVDVGVQRKELNAEIEGRTLWLLHIPNSSESQSWITAIKDSILVQRAEKSGLRHVFTESKMIEPRGDMDVMLSMRAQNLSSGVPRVDHRNSQLKDARPSSSTSNNTEIASNRLKTSSPNPTVRSLSSDGRPTSTAVSTLKGLFASGRPRSPSRASSALSKDRDPEDAVSFTTRGNALLGLLRSNGVVTDAEANSNSPSFEITPRIPTDSNPSFPVSSTLSTVQITLDQPIVKDLGSVEWLNSDDIPTPIKTPVLLISEQSLPPPPRNRRPWTSSGVPGSIIDNRGFIVRSGRSSFQGPSSASVTRTSHEGESNSSKGRHSPDSSFAAAGGTDIHEYRGKRASVSSTISSLASGFHEREPNGSSVSSKRRSRMSTLPQMLTPPSGPPPSVPLSSSPNGSILHPYAAEQSLIKNPSILGHSSEIIVDESTYPSKRFSASSALSTSSNGTTQSRVNKIFASRHLPAPAAMPSKRASMPPPRPAPTFAIPPTPSHIAPSNNTSTVSKRTSFRESISQRSSRVSPTSGAVPRRSQDYDYRPRPNTSTGIGLNAASGSTRPFGPRAPPPTGPLPPTPSSGPTNPANPAVVQRTSIKRRLRLKSAPTPSPNRSPSLTMSEVPKTISTIPNVAENRSSLLLLGEPITTRQNEFDFNDYPDSTTPKTLPGDTNFMQLTSTPPVSIYTTNSISQNEINAIYPTGSSPDTIELKSLTPPPRRGARHLSIPGETNHSGANVAAIRVPGFTSIIPSSSIFADDMSNDL